MPRKRTYRRAGKGAYKKRAKDLPMISSRGRRMWKATPFYARSNQLTGFGFPESIYTKHRYVEEIVLNASNVAIDYYVFSANGMYDPNITGTGHQPLGFDQCGLLYNSYKVVKSRIRVVPLTIDTVNHVPAYFACILAPDTTTAGSISGASQLLESNIKSKRFVVGGPYAQTMDGGGNRVMISQRFNAKEYFKNADNEQEGTTAANPAEQAYFQVIAASMNGNNPEAIPLLVTIDYEAIWSEPKLLAQS